MIEPTWNDWFVREEIEGTDPDGLSIWYLGCNGFVLRTAETTLYIDPYFGTGEHRPYAVRMLPIPMDPMNATVCDAIFITHEHVDHMHPPSYAPLLEETDANLYAPTACFDEPDYKGSLQIPSNQKNHIHPGNTFDIGDVTITVHKANDPDAIEPVSYLVEAASGTFFHAGDSRSTDVFEELGTRYDIDAGALAFGTAGKFFDEEIGKSRRVKWYMNGDEVIEACNALQLDRLLPTHHDMWKGFRGSPSILHDHASSSMYPRTIDVVEIGDRVELGHSGIIPPCYTQ